MEFFLFWIFFAIVVGIAAGSRGRNGFGWFLLSLVISPLIGLILVLVIPNKAAEKIRAAEAAAAKAERAAEAALAGAEPITTQTHTRCPDCKEWVRRDALVCKHCRRKLEPTAVAPEPAAAARSPAGAPVVAPSDPQSWRKSDTQALWLTIALVVGVFVAAYLFTFRT